MLYGKVWYLKCQELSTMKIWKYFEQIINFYEMNAAKDGTSKKN